MKCMRGRRRFCASHRTFASNSVRSSGFLYISSQAAGADGTVTNEEQSLLFQQLSQGDPEVFSRRMITTHLLAQNDEARYRLFYGTPVRARHTNNFIAVFERLIARAKEVDPDGMICDALYSTSHGLLYGIAKRYQSNAPRNSPIRRAPAPTSNSEANEGTCNANMRRLLLR